LDQNKTYLTSIYSLNALLVLLTSESLIDLMNFSGYCKCSVFCELNKLYH